MEERTDKTTKRAGARARVALWKAALGEGPGEAPGPAGRALLADLRKLWLTREEEQRRAMREPPFPLPVDLAAQPLAALWGWWPEWRGGDDGPDGVSIGHWRGMHDAAVHARVALFGRPDGLDLYPVAVQMAATLLPALFHATAQGDAHAFALALETLSMPNPGYIELDGPTAWFGSRDVSPLFEAVRETDQLEEAHRRARASLFRLGLRAGIAEAAWNAMRLLWTNPGDAEASGFRFRRNRNGFLHPPWAGLAFRAADAGCPDAMPAADSFREARAEDGDRFLSEAERCRRKVRRLSRAWRRIGPLAIGKPSSVSVAEEWARTGDEFNRLCRKGELPALASLARGVLGNGWRGDAYGPWRPAPNWPEEETQPGEEPPSAFAEAVFRKHAAAGDAFGCFYLGQLAWKRAFDRIETIRARRSDGTETRLRFFDRDRRFLEVPCAEADRWFRRGAALGGRGARECERTLAWREKTRYLRSEAQNSAKRSMPSSMVAVEQA